MMKFKVQVYLFVWFLLLCAIYGCNPNTADLPVIAAKNGQVTFFNFIPNQGAINLYVNGTRQNSNRIAFGESSGYMSIASGDQAISFKTDDTRDIIYPSILNKIDTLNSTFFVTGKVNAVTLIKTIDTAKTDKNYKPKVRVVSASADSPPFDIVLNNITISNQAYKSVSTFSRVDTGKVNLTVKVNGIGTIVFNKPITLQQNGIYTMFIYGSYAGGTNGLSLNIRQGY